MRPKYNDHCSKIILHIPSDLLLWQREPTEMTVKHHMVRTDEARLAADYIKTFGFPDWMGAFSPFEDWVIGFANDGRAAVHALLQEALERLSLPENAEVEYGVCGDDYTAAITIFYPPWSVEEREAVAALFTGEIRAAFRRWGDRGFPGGEHDPESS